MRTIYVYADASYYDEPQSHMSDDYAAVLVPDAISDEDCERVADVVANGRGQDALDEITFPYYVGG